MEILLRIVVCFETLLVPTPGPAICLQEAGFLFLTASSTIPSNGRHVVGPTTFSGFIRAPTTPHR